MNAYNNPIEPKEGFNKELLNDLCTWLHSYNARKSDNNLTTIEEAKKLYNFIQSVNHSQTNNN